MIKNKNNLFYFPQGYQSKITDPKRKTSLQSIYVKTDPNNQSKYNLSLEKSNKLLSPTHFKYSSYFDEEFEFEKQSNTKFLTTKHYGENFIKELKKDYFNNYKILDKAEYRKMNKSKINDNSQIFTRNNKNASSLSLEKRFYNFLDLNTKKGKNRISKF